MNQITSKELSLSNLSLEERIKSQIRMEGPISISVYMQLALHDRKQGYYATRPGLMRDFSTAPEISQVFGELIGAWLVHEWRVMKCPDPFDIVEIGPGWGSLMVDALRVASQDADFMDAMTLRLVEPSPALREVQAERLAAYNPQFYATLEQLPRNAALVVANEWLDCLPIRQFVKSQNGWRERVIGLNENDELTFGLSPTLQGLPADPPDDAWEWEYSPALEAAVDELALRFRENPGRALLFDYGPTRRTPADSFRAYREGEQVPPLETPGEIDLTADVDFSAIHRHAELRNIASYGPAPQGLFLKKMGIEARVSTLMSLNWRKKDDIAAAAYKISAPDQMGSRFKAICLSNADLQKPFAF